MQDYASIYALSSTFSHFFWHFPLYIISYIYMYIYIYIYIYAVEFFRRDAEKHKPLHKDDTQKQLWLPLLPWLKVTKICGGQCAALAGEVKEV